MKKNITINLFGQLYNIDEDAYDLLDRYEKNMRDYYERNFGDGEVADDVERRVAELFLELNNQGVNAITIEHVQDIIKQIGEPNQMDTNETANNDHSNEAPATTSNYCKLIQNRLYRDPYDSVLGGVLSGITAFLGIKDPIWLRLLFVLLIFFGFGFPILVYLVLWLLLPAAYTAQERLEMKGIHVNPENIKKEILSEAPENNRIYSGNKRSALSRMISMLGKICVVLLIAIIFLLLIFSLVVSVSGILMIAISPIEYFSISFLKYKLWIYLSCIFGSIFSVSALTLLIRRFKNTKSNVDNNKTKKALLATMSIAFVFAVASLTYFGIQYKIDRDKLCKQETELFESTLRPNSLDKLFMLGWNECSTVNSANSLYARHHKTYYVSLKKSNGSDSGWYFDLKRNQHLTKGNYELRFMYKTDRNRSVFAYIKLNDSIILTQPLPVEKSEEKSSNLIVMNPLCDTEVWKDWNGYDKDDDDVKDVGGWKLAKLKINVPRSGLAIIGFTNNLNHNCTLYPDKFRIHFVDIRPIAKG